MKIISTLIVTLLLMVSSVSSQAGNITFNSDNGHYYQLIDFSDLGQRFDWEEAKAYSETLIHDGMQGYLATVTSAAEDTFIWNLGAQGFFLGAFDNSIEVNGVWEHQVWQWVTGESFSYQNWTDGEPNHWQDGFSGTADNEDYLMYWWEIGGNGGWWNDTNIDSSYYEDDVINFTTAGFVVEYSPTAAASPVPVPATIWLFGSALLALFPKWRMRRPVR